MTESNFPARLRELLNKTGMTHDDLAEHLHVKHQAVSNWVRGTNLPRFTTIIRIADMCGLDCRDFFSDDPLPLKGTCCPVCGKGAQLLYCKGETLIGCDNCITVKPIIFKAVSPKEHAVRQQMPEPKDPAPDPSANEYPKKFAKQNGVSLWEVAQELGIADTTLSKKLRHELPPEERDQFIFAVREIARRRGNAS